MFPTLDKLFFEWMKLSPDNWMYLLLAVEALALIVPLIIGLAAGDFKKIKGIMGAVIANPSTMLVHLKKMPASIKGLYKTARMTNSKPSLLVTQDVCVDKPYARSLISKLWIPPFVATVIDGLIAPTVFSNVAGDEYSGALITLIACGGLLTLVGAIVAKLALVGAVKKYQKFAAAIDGDNAKAPDMPAAAPEAQQYEQPVEQVSEYTEPVTEYAAEPVYEQPVQPEPEPEPAPSYREQAQAQAQERARQEEAMRAHQQAQAQAQAQQQQQYQQQQAEPAAPRSSADEVIAEIERISREGATRDQMRAVASQLQKERAKPENKTPEIQKKLNDALGKLLKAMSAATRK